VVSGRGCHIPNKFGGKDTVVDITHALCSLDCKLWFAHELRWSDRLTILPWQSEAETVASLASEDSKLQQWMPARKAPYKKFSMIWFFVTFPASSDP